MTDILSRLKRVRFLIHRVATRRPPDWSSAAVALSTGVNSGMPFPIFIKPILRMFTAAFRSRSMMRPQTSQWYVRSESFRSCFMLPHAEQSFDEFRDYMDLAVKDYNSVRPHSSLNYLTPDEFEERIAIDREFKEKWLKKQIGRYKNVELLE